MHNSQFQLKVKKKHVKITMTIIICFSYTTWKYVSFNNNILKHEGKRCENVKFRNSIELLSIQYRLLKF